MKGPKARPTRVAVRLHPLFVDRTQSTNRKTIQDNTSNKTDVTLSYRKLLESNML